MELTRRLEDAIDAEDHGIGYPDKITTKMISNLEEASGIFEGIAITLKAKSPVQKTWVKKWIDKIKKFFTKK